MWERRLEAEGAPEGLAFFLFFGESREPFGEVRHNAIALKERKKRKPLGDLGGRVGNLKLTPKVFFFF